jgi:DNA polymerase delta subunit 2
MTIIRKLNELDYVNLSDNFYIKSKSFQYQYAPLYAERLASMRKEIIKAVNNKWKNEYPIKSLVNLDKSEKCVIIGTLYKEMKNKPNILKELADDENGAFILQPVLNKDQKYIDQDDQLVLEDELQRIILIDAPQSSIIKSNNLCTGLVVGILGLENENSKFEVEDLCFKETLYYPIKNKPNNDKYIVFISGLGLGDAKMNENLYKMQLFVDYLLGDFIEDMDSDEFFEKERDMLKNMSRLIIAGNSLSSITQTKDIHNKAKYLTKNYVAGSVSAIKQLDDFLYQLSNKIEVDLMPGEYDPSNMMLPQQPLHKAMFTKSKEIKTFHSATNPYRFKLNDICFLGTSGQSIDDIRRSTDMEESTEIMKLLLNSGHIGPTCPDTLACYPYYGKDPFILDSLPHVFFAGNQKKFQHEIYIQKHLSANNKIHLISLPIFCSTFSCVIFNLNTFECEEIFF